MEGPVRVNPTHPVNIPCGRKPEYPEKTHDFRQSVDYHKLFPTGIEPTLAEVKGARSDKCATEAPGEEASFSSVKKMEIRGKPRTDRNILVYL